MNSKKVDNGIFAKRLKVLEEAVNSMIEKFQDNIIPHTDDKLMASRLTSLEEAVRRLIPEPREKRTSASSRDNQVALNGMNNPDGKITSLITSSKKEKRIINRMKVNEDENDNVIDGPSWTEVIRLQHCLYQLH